MASLPYWFMVSVLICSVLSKLSSPNWQNTYGTGKCVSGVHFMHLGIGLGTVSHEQVYHTVKQQQALLFHGTFAFSRNLILIEVKSILLHWSGCVVSDTLLLS